MNDGNKIRIWQESQKILSRGKTCNTEGKKRRIGGKAVTKVIIINIIIIFIMIIKIMIENITFTKAAPDIGPW